jgi:membrane-bound lytic murein transglycosylase A
MWIHRLICAALVCSLLAACGGKKDYTRPLPPGEVALVKITDPERIPDFRPAFANRVGLEASIDESLSYFDKPSSQEFYPYLDITHDRARESLLRFKEVLHGVNAADDFHRRIVAEFDVYESRGCDDEGTVLFTGYFTPIYEASRKPAGAFRHALYTKPDDLVREGGRTRGRKTPDGGIVPYYTRAEIENRNTLAGNELVYLRDPFDAYVIQVQGSAILRMRDGSRLSIGFAGDNGYEYESVGQMLVADGKIKKRELSLAKLRQHFRMYPEEFTYYTRRNPRFVFFQPAPGGPFGCLGAKVTPYASLATDKMPGSPDIYPRGSLAMIQTKMPRALGGGKVAKVAYSGFVLDQDRGSAIRSAGRADVYMGVGPEAEVLAGHTLSEGRLYYIFVK